MYSFDAQKAMNECIEWIRDWFGKNGPESPAVIGISGGKDSTVTAGLCTAALGKDRVIGVLMPNGIQADINDSLAVVKHLDITNYTIDISGAVSALLKEMNDKNITFDEIFDMFWVYIPVPFKKGDILVSADKTVSRNNRMVLKSVCYWNRTDE